MAVSRPIRIAVCGSGIAPDDVEAAAFEVGQRLAQAGAVLVCGGRDGVMRAAARGAAEAGGLTVGFLPGTAPDEANPYVRLPIPTGMGEGRNLLIVRAAEAVIAIGGGWGTLSEIALAGEIGVPTVLLSPTLAAGLDLPEAETPADAVRQALEQARDRRLNSRIGSLAR